MPSAARLLLVILLAAPPPAPALNSASRESHVPAAGESGALSAGSAPPQSAPVEGQLPSQAASGARRTRAVAAAAWLKLMADYSRSSSSSSKSEPSADDGEWFPRPVPVSLPIGRGGATMPVLILPVPVPADELAQCSTGEPGAAGTSREAPPAPPAPPPPPGALAAPARHSLPPAADTTRHHSAQDGDEPIPPHLDYITSSQQLVELFQSQVGRDAELPPALIPDYTAGEDGPFTGEAAADEPAAAAESVRRPAYLRVRRYPQGAAAPQAAPQAGPAPPPPRLQRSVMLRADLTVPRSGYTEPYTVWWDAASGASRVDLHGGATSAYRMILPDGRVQELEMRTDRSGETEVRRCAVAAPRAREPSDRLVPGFPDMDQFSFAGYSQAEWGRVERWTRAVVGGAGEGGGARGEALLFRHEVLVARAPDNYTATPLRYSVSVDSSVLGANCDGYVHRYTELRDQRHDPALLALNIAEACEQVEMTTRRHRVDPLREYTLPHRDARHDLDFHRFKTEHNRQYSDETEEAVRKTVMVQHSRFVDSGNRQGATHAVEMNYLGDRLDAELALLRGVGAADAGLAAEPFPHSRAQLAAMRASLPRAFDWRTRGAVTHVRYQGSCSSCWAFAVTGAVEGALFVRTRRLAALSEQCLVDCAQPYGAHGCGRTWPAAAYDYVAERGLPALDEYTPYRERVLACLDRRVPPVTHISAHVNVTAHDVHALKVAIRRHAPTVVLIDSTAKSFMFYKRGVLNDDRCAKDSAEHAVLAVGWGEQRREPHFILKNSWSAKWGDGGYVRVAARPNTCGVLARPSYPRLERPDVDAPQPH